MTVTARVVGRRRRLRLLGWAVLALVAGFAADQLTKLWALMNLADGSSIALLPSVSLRLAFNPGVAFSLGADSGPLLAMGVLLVLLALTAWIGFRIWRGLSLLGTVLLSVVAAGGWGNMSDRLTRAENGFLSGHVVDFIAVDWFAVFNLGDVLAVCGMFAWVLVSLFVRGRPAGDVGAPRTSEAT